jgi:hypothetical protein
LLALQYSSLDAFIIECAGNRTSPLVFAQAPERKRFLPTFLGI